MDYSRILFGELSFIGEKYEIKGVLCKQSGTISTWDAAIAEKFVLFCVTGVDPVIWPRRSVIHSASVGAISFQHAYRVQSLLSSYQILCECARLLPRTWDRTACMYVGLYRRCTRTYTRAYIPFRRVFVRECTRAYIRHERVSGLSS